MLEQYRSENHGSLSPTQIQFYDEEGYLALPHLLNDADMAAVIRSMEQKVDTIADDLCTNGLITDKLAHESFENRLARLFDGKTDAEFLKYGRSWRDRLPGYFNLMANPKIISAVESLIGGEIFANPVYNTRPKVPKVAAGTVPWHQDRSYWPDANANPVITVWVALVDANLENGCLHFMPQTHRQKLLSHHREEYTSTKYTEIDQEHLVDKERAVALPIEKGGVILFNDRCVHMSTPNDSSHVRWSVDLRYQPTDQDPMPQHGAGFLARSYKYPERMATLEDWLASRPEHALDQQVA